MVPSNQNKKQLFWKKLNILVVYDDYKAQTVLLNVLNIGVDTMEKINK